MREGTLFCNLASGRMDINFGIEEYYGGLHCGECFEVMIDDKWIPVRIEMSLDDEWYLVGVKTKDLAGLTVRI